MSEARLIALLVSVNDYESFERTTIRVQPVHGSAADSVDIQVDHGAKGHTNFLVEPGAELLPGIYSAGHLLSVLLPAVYAKWGDEEQFHEVFAQPIEFEVPLAPFAGA
jgi:hypothetical protein